MVIVVKGQMLRAADHPEEVAKYHRDYEKMASCVAEQVVQFWGYSPSALKPIVRGACVADLVADGFMSVDVADGMADDMTARALRQPAN